MFIVRVKDLGDDRTETKGIQASGWEEDNGRRQAMPTRRRLRGDLSETFKLFLGFDEVNINYLVINLERTTRNNGFDIVGREVQTEDSNKAFLLQ